MATRGYLTPWDSNTPLVKPHPADRGALLHTLLQNKGRDQQTLIRRPSDRFSADASPSKPSRALTTSSIALRISWQISFILG